MEIVKVKRRGASCMLCREKINGRYYVESWRKFHLSCYYEIRVVEAIKNNKNQLANLTKEYMDLRDQRRKGIKAQRMRLKEEKRRFYKYKKYMALEKL